ncbi:CDP-alcohol phosphatidyltransferase family protein [Phenylobacterium sp.]|jgi:CDP-diacylglycerol--glycerol-3-phosphate 3-phosphatidyltransferase|uniref:CDP-alcohol phosphatidyltransferase family protein n=1 Tax=Phenylobacterium sp. TaxID=1871053 RepID=UPI002F925D46
MPVQAVPRLLIWFRLAAGLAMLALAAAFDHEARAAAVVLLGLGVLSDIFDGVIARRLGVATAELRTFDSRTDLVSGSASRRPRWSFTRACRPPPGPSSPPSLGSRRPPTWSASPASGGRPRRIT